MSTLSNRLRRWFRKGKSKQRPAPIRKLILEQLEDRCLPSALLVQTDAGFDGSGDVGMSHQTTPVIQLGSLLPRADPT